MKIQHRVLYRPTKISHFIPSHLVDSAMNDLVCITTDGQIGIVPKLTDDAIVAQAIARQPKCIWTKRPEGIKDAALKGGATTARLAKGTGLPSGRCKRKRDSSLRRPTLSQE